MTITQKLYHLLNINIVEIQKELLNSKIIKPICFRDTSHKLRPGPAKGLWKQVFNVLVADLRKLLRQSIT